MENQFNLIDEPWLPVADRGRVSLRQIFSNSEYRALGGNPVQKIALMKLLLAIAQAACTPKDEQEWKALEAAGLAQHCLAYLDKWYDRFYLYGEKPFLQMSAIEKLIADRTEKKLATAKTLSKKTEAIQSGSAKRFGAGFYPDLPSENNTQLSQTLFHRTLSDAEKAIFLVTLMNFSFGGKRIEFDLTSLAGDVLKSGYTAYAGPSLGSWNGQLHCFPLVDSILESLWFNLMTGENFQKLNPWPSGVGIPLWERMPETEKDTIAEAYKTSYQAGLVALSRFVLLKDEGVFYLDGIQYPKVKEGWTEPSLLINKSGKEIKTKYADPEKRPWRELEAILAVNVFSSSTGFECIALKVGINRIVESNHKIFSIWCGGIKVSSNSGDQSVKQGDDFVESQVWLHSSMLGESWFAQLQAEMSALDISAKTLYGCVMAYFKEQLVDGSKLAAQATQLFWQLCERDFQTLLDSCNQDEKNQHQRHKLRLRFASYVRQAYNRFCPNETARQLDAWAKRRPNLSQYLK
ncbi:CRISPR-associated protein Cse1 [Candidatus Nitrosoglobus terrae]|uniref:CRISPR-associated protein Cse1 n=1 Tax=Candidatus Nitrosoglobus terrae TaxID=1630141 RepID=A0A1Q2SPJ6_9GAMM|nr:type I-E CRISPR-associated protein Cse1/CasA [Candidatus Nitrosoglobus terrae]BAW81085.1 CRISPR-associated protein Cse1 [Candidatus Nitrosoglobus terrae]